MREKKTGVNYDHIFPPSGVHSFFGRSASKRRGETVVTVHPKEKREKDHDRQRREKTVFCVAVAESEIGHLSFGGEQGNRQKQPRKKVLCLTEFTKKRAFSRVSATGESEKNFEI